MTPVRRKSDVINYVVGIIVSICAFLAVWAFNKMDQQYAEQNVRLARIEDKMDRSVETAFAQSEKLTKLAAQIERRLSKIEDKVYPGSPQPELEVKARNLSSIKQAKRGIELCSIR